ncbi:FGGY-family carbohydrate kinase [Cohaesibacter intestini]|uniref:FGGY-family carbohydrate kinase n=1 Tax=Cohaesibacter intestini TaxID=2211145 RepID=UPI000DEB4F68|nr:FGGY-family carbohydrate kinase [Cohaesibacter intestini]
MAYLLGIDNGLTNSKAVVFDLDGNAIATARRRIAQRMPQPHFVERDMVELWLATAGAIKEALESAACQPSEILAVGATAHGDGLYLLDHDQQPLGNGILSLDSRAGDIVTDWQQGGTDRAALELSGQCPHLSAPAALLAWIRRHQPERFDKIGSVIACKDWLRFCLTGTVGTDLTEASISFTDPHSQDYRGDILTLYGLESLSGALPDIALPDEIVGYVTDEAAMVTGLARGTPVVAGLHDVTASALGAGGYGVGSVAIVAGTYSINETVSNAPKIDPRWFCRNGIRRGEWNNMAISPASAANYDWVLDTFCQQEKAQHGEALHIMIAAELETARDNASAILFHPYLFGSPHGPGSSAGFLGLHGWHGRGDVLRALMEGIAFNHRLHCDALREGFSPTIARLTGGISRNPVYAQLFADALAMKVSVSDVDEPAAWGAALCAGSGAGLFASPTHDPRADAGSDQIAIYDPNPIHRQQLDTLYALHCEASEALRPIWQKLEDLSQSMAASKGVAQ